MKFKAVLETIEQNKKSDTPRYNVDKRPREYYETEVEGTYLYIKSQKLTDNNWKMVGTFRDLEAILSYLIYDVGYDVKNIPASIQNNGVHKLIDSNDEVRIEKKLIQSGTYTSTLFPENKYGKENKHKLFADLNIPWYDENKLDKEMADNWYVYIMYDIRNDTKEEKLKTIEQYIKTSKYSKNINLLDACERAKRDVENDKKIDAKELQKKANDLSLYATVDKIK